MLPSLTITGNTRLLGVMGYPIAHSLSPVMHNAALAALQAEGLELDYVYLPLAIAPEDLSVAVAGLAAIGVQGFNVTIPHKQAILPFLVSVSPIAQAVGAVNTVWRDQQGWQGTNTDVQGFLAPLRGLSRHWSEMRVLILGTGGAARAVVVACVEMGCTAVAIVGREQEKLARFQSQFQSLTLKSAVLTLDIFTWDQLAALLPETELVVNSTPIGMVPHPDQSPFNEELINLLPPGAIVYDLIYNPRPTRLLQLAQGRGLVAIDGLEMLVQQGAAALEIWLQRSVPVEVMRRAAETHLGLRTKREQVSG